MTQIAIVGFGCAGYHCAKTLREKGFSGQIHVFSDTELPPYNPMLTTYYAGGRLPWEGMFPFGPLEEIARTLSLTVHAPMAVTGLAAVHRALRLADGSSPAFDAILISTGAHPFLPPGLTLPSRGVCVLRTPADARALRQLLESGRLRSAVVVGASMAGIKAAELFQQAGISCTIADLAPSLFPLSAAPDVGAELGRRVRAQGIGLELGAALEELRATPSGGVVLTLGGRTVRADVAVLAMGVRPNLEFLGPDGPRTDRGILVNHRMESSIPGIYAAGDCACGPDVQSGLHRTIALWANAGYQGTTAAGAMLGREVRCPAVFPHNITHFLGMDFIGFGDARARGEVLRYRRGSFFLYAVRQGRRLALLNIIDNCQISGVLKNYMTRLFQGDDVPVTPAQRIALLRSGLEPQVIDLLEHRSWEGGPAHG